MNAAYPYSVARWVEPAAAASDVAAMNQEIGDIRSKLNHAVPATPRSWNWIAASLTFVGLVVFAIFIAWITADNPKVREPNYLALVALLGGVTALVYWGVGLLDKRTAGRFEAFHNMGLRHADMTPLFRQQVSAGAPGGFPWFYDERGEAKWYAWATGQHQGLDFHWLETGQTVDPIVMQQSVIGKGVMAVAAGRNRRQRMRAADTIVFTAPLNLPDFFLVPKGDVDCGYLRNNLGDRATEIPLPGHKPGFFSNPADIGPWAITSDPAFVDRLITPELEDLMSKQSRLFVQIVGGFVAVHQESWLQAVPMYKVLTEQQIVDYLDFACKVYSSLQNADTSH